MIIKTLTLENFRKFKRQGFRFNSRFNVLIGRNATGKTQVLDALALILSVYTVKFLDKTKMERRIKPSDVRIEQTPYEQEDGSVRFNFQQRYPVTVSAQIIYRNQVFEQTCSLESNDGRTTFGGRTPLSQLAEQEFTQATDGSRFTMSFIGYYGTGRAKLSRKATPINPDSRTTDGYKDVLNPNVLYDDLEDWIKEQIYQEFYEKRLSTDLEIVRRALKQTILGCQDICYNSSLKKVCLKYDNGISEPLNNLSDGCRCIVRMVADIARRIASMNAIVLGVKALDETPGVVLIDEIDLYLHPEWQRSVVENLKNAFPKLQFIATTHSPFIIQSLKPGELIDLEICNGQTFSYGSLPLYGDEAEDEIAAPAPENDYSEKSPEDITEDVMGVYMTQWSKRRLDMYEAAQEYYKLLNSEESVSPEKKKILKDELDKLRKRFSDDVAYYAFLDMERLAKESE